MTLRAKIKRIDLGKEVFVAAPAAHDLRGQRGGGPRIQHIGVADEAAGLVALRLGESGCGFGGGIHRQHVIRGAHGVVIVRIAGGVQRVPDRERHSEEPLAGDEPVSVESLDPVLIPAAHEGRVEVDLPAAGDEPFPPVGVASTVADVPLAAGDHFQGLVTLFKEVHRVHDLLWLTLEQSGRAELFNHRLLGREDSLSCQFRVEFPARRRRHPVRRIREDAAVPADDGARGQIQLAPPGHVSEVAEGADHGNAGTLVRLGQRMGQDQNLHSEERRSHSPAEEGLVAFVVRMGHQRHAGCKQFRPGGLNKKLFAVRRGKRVAVVGPRNFAVLEFGLGHSSAEGDIPEGWSFRHIGIALFEVGQEGTLGDRT